MCAYINSVIKLKIALINEITMGIFNFYPFLPILDPFLTFFDPFLPFLAFGYIWGQIPMECYMCIYRLCKNAKNLTHKWYFYDPF